MSSYHINNVQNNNRRRNSYETNLPLVNLEEFKEISDSCGKCWIGKERIKKIVFDVATYLMSCACFYTKGFGFGERVQIIRKKR